MIMVLKSECKTVNIELFSSSENLMKVSIIGSGVVGQATGRGLAHHGNDVVFNDIDQNKLSHLSNKGYKVTKSVLDAVFHSDIVFVCVPTPTTNSQIDLSFIKSITIDLAKALKEAQKYTVLVFKSTILPQTTRTIIVPKLEKVSGLKAGKDFGVCMNPEFLTELNPLEDFLNPARIIIGEFDKRSGDILERLYSSFNCSIIRTDLDTAEMIKYVSNLFLASKISIFNEFYMICNTLGIDAQRVSEAASLDPRIGKYGTRGGKPFGGMCFPKDLAAFLAFAKSKELQSNILDAVAQVNKEIMTFNSKNDK
jgi:UDPglucose 6-dehydrogenase